MYNAILECIFMVVTVLFKIIIFFEHRWRMSELPIYPGLVIDVVIIMKQHQDILMILSKLC